MWIPVIYPDARRQFWGRAALEPVNGPVYLSQIAISIYKPTRDEMFHYSYSYATGTKYVSFFGAKGQVKVEKTTMGGKDILTFTFRRDLLVDSTGTFRDGTQGTSLAMTDEKTPLENLLAATQLLRSWLVQMQIRYEPDTGITAWLDEYKPPVLAFNPLGASAQVLNDITTLDGTPLAVR